MKYTIYTDSTVHDPITAESVTDALTQACIPATDADSFVRWLEDLGGYGAIREDGILSASTGLRRPDHYELYTHIPRLSS